MKIALVDAGKRSHRALLGMDERDLRRDLHDPTVRRV